MNVSYTKVYLFIKINIYQNEKLIKKHNLKNLLLICEDFRLLNFDKKFDIIICRHLVEHIKECKNFISSLKNNLSSKGIIALEVPNVEYYIDFKSSETFFLQHYHYFSFYSINKLLSISGFRIFKKISRKKIQNNFSRRKKIFFDRIFFKPQEHALYFQMHPRTPSGSVCE